MVSIAKHHALTRKYFRTQQFRLRRMLRPKRIVSIVLFAVLLHLSIQQIKYWSWRLGPLYVPTGDYSYNKLTSNGELSVSVSVSGGTKALKVMLFVTTHMSTQHIWYLKACWPVALKHSPLLRNSDIAVYLNPKKEGRKPAMELLRETFKDQNLTIHVHDTAQRQEGAMAALADASRGNWFSGYDWIIRVNPDVIIRNDTWMLDIMRNDPNATGLLINCHNITDTTLKIHTDFFAVKPEALPPNAFLHPITENAEYSFTSDIKKTIIDRGNHRWVPGANPYTTACRAATGRDRSKSHVTHFHQARRLFKNLTCPIAF